MTEDARYRTVGACLDAGVEWDQFTTHAWDGVPVFTSREDAEAHRNDRTVEWDEEEL